MWTYRKLALSSVSNHTALRCDAKYRLFWGLNGGMLYPESKIEVHTLGHALLPFEPVLARKGNLEKSVELVELEDVEKRSGVIASSTQVDQLNSAKLIFGTADLVTSRLRPNLGKTILNDQSRRLAGTTEWIPLKLNRERLHPLLAKYYLLSGRYVDHAERLLSGKEHPRVAQSDIAALRVPYPSLQAQNHLVQRIEELENDQRKARARLRSPGDIIDETLCNEFGYPLREHRDRIRLRHFRERFSGLARGHMLRNSAKFHHPDFELTGSYFARVTHQRIKAFVSAPIRLGATANEGDFVEDGAAYYVHPGATKRQGVIALEDCYQVTQEFFDATQRRFGLRPGDVLINRSGEALGKVAIFETDESAVFSDFTMRVRFGPKMNPRFAWYFFRSVMFQTQVERELRGSSVPNIFPPEVERMLIVDCKRDRQDAIATEISNELSKLDALRVQIEAKRAEINRLIDEAVAGSAPGKGDLRA